jgi:hypothetical protein
MLPQDGGCDEKLCARAGDNVASGTYGRVVDPNGEEMGTLGILGTLFA